MGSPRKRRAKKLLAGNILKPAGLTQFAAADLTSSVAMNNHLSASLFAGGPGEGQAGGTGTTPTIINPPVLDLTAGFSGGLGSTTLLTDAISNELGVLWNGGATDCNTAGFSTGETTFFSGSNSVVLGNANPHYVARNTQRVFHYTFPRFRAPPLHLSGAFAGTDNQPMSGNFCVIIYTPNAPRSQYVNFYFTGAMDSAQATGTIPLQPADMATASILFGSDITGSAITGNMGLPETDRSHKFLNIYFAGIMRTGSAASAGGSDNGADRIIVTGSAIPGRGWVMNGSGSFLTGVLSIPTGAFDNRQNFDWPTIGDGADYNGHGDDPRNAVGDAQQRGDGGNNGGDPYALTITFSSSMDAALDRYAGAMLIITASNDGHTSVWEPAGNGAGYGGAGAVGPQFNSGSW